MNGFSKLWEVQYVLMNAHGTSPDSAWAINNGLSTETPMGAFSTGVT
jgi:hypothetical protein